MISFRQLLVTLLVIGLVWGFYHLKQRWQARRAKPQPSVAYRDTVRCPQCQLYLPRTTVTSACDHLNCPLRKPKD